jgi:hypothetical protein
MKYAPGCGSSFRVGRLRVWDPRISLFLCLFCCLLHLILASFVQRSGGRLHFHLHLSMAMASFPGVTDVAPDVTVFGGYFQPLAVVKTTRRAYRTSGSGLCKNLHHNGRKYVHLGTTFKIMR